MSRLYGSVENGTGSNVIWGSETEGLVGYLESDNTGCRIELDVNPTTGRGRIAVYRTTGKRGNPENYKLVCTWEEGESVNIERG